MKPNLNPVAPFMIGCGKMKLDLVINALERNASLSRCPLPQMAKRDDLMNHTFQGA